MRKVSYASRPRTLMATTRSRASGRCATCAGSTVDILFGPWLAYMLRIAHTKVLLGHLLHFGGFASMCALPQPLDLSLLHNRIGSILFSSRLAACGCSTCCVTAGVVLQHNFQIMASPPQWHTGWLTGFICIMLCRVSIVSSESM